MRNISRRVLGPALLALPGMVLLAPPAAHAGTDSKIFGGTNCVANGNGAGHELSHLPAGQVVNDADGTVYTVCAVVRDNTVGNWQSLSVVVTDNHPTYDVNCTFRIGNAEGGTTYVKTARSSGTGLQTLRVTSDSSYPQRTPYTLFCSIPGKYGTKKSAIHYYRLDESD